MTLRKKRSYKCYAGFQPKQFLPMLPSLLIRSMVEADALVSLRIFLLNETAIMVSPNRSLPLWRCVFREITRKKLNFLRCLGSIEHPVKRASAASWLSRSIARFLRKPDKLPPMSARSLGQIRPHAPTKAETALLKPFAGLSPDRILVPKTKTECEAAAHEILLAGVAGFDTEAKPTFRAGEKSGGPHVVQFALADKAYIFQLHRKDCLEVVAGLIESERVLKVGFGLKNDHGQIRNRLGVIINHVLDLDHVFRKRGFKQQIGVRAAMGATLNLSFPKSKSTTTSNWAATELTSRQLLYAANDAFAALKIMEALDIKTSRFPDTERLVCSTLQHNKQTHS